MIPPDGRQQAVSRRSFLLSSSGMFTTAWLAAQLPAIKAAAHHADAAAAAAAPLRFTFFNSEEAADVEAVGAQIVPSGATPGARECRAVYFIDQSLGSYLAALAADYRQGLAEFQAGFKAAPRRAPNFAAADSHEQIEFLASVEHTPWFATTRMLTILGLTSSPKYGGNFQGLGWSLMGFVDQHAFQPPFGYYDRDYPGFVPYSSA